MDELVCLRQSFRWYIKHREGALLNIVLKLHPGNRGRALERLRECGYKTDRELVEFLERTGGMRKRVQFSLSRDAPGTQKTREGGLAAMAANILSGMVPSAFPSSCSFLWEPRG
ncbi:MAG: hypothetical protein ACLT38_10440 [Akkermansia sp.]